MKCHNCSAGIQPGGEREHHGKVLCEDCYLDALTPAKPCDPWAVYAAKSYEAQTGGASYTPLQSEILAALKAGGGMEPAALKQKLSPAYLPEEVEKAFATLRHMEKARAEKRDGTIFWRVW